MATKDYVKKRPQARPNKRKTNSKTTSLSPPWIKVSVALIVVALFVFALYRLSLLGTEQKPSEDLLAEDLVDNAPAKDTKPLMQNTDKPAQLNADNKDELDVLKPLPVLAEEEWEYIDSLPDFEVEVDATGPLESNKDFIMQCGSFRQESRAEELRASIAFQGLESRILSSEGKNGLWYRVVLGPYDKKRNAERHRHQLRLADIRGCKIW